jgi:chromosomal replication initiator protein
MKVIWDEIIICLKDHLSGPGFQTFLSSTSPIRLENSVLTIEVQNEFSKEWIKDNCEQLLHHHLPSLHNIVIHYEIAPPEEKEPQQLSILSRPVSSSNILQGTMFNRKYAFDNFIVGHNNRFAYASCEAVSKAPARAYNPLFIYGSVGLGKTHLLHAIGLKLNELYPHLKAHLVSCEKFTNDLINAIKDKSVEPFREKYRTVDVLIVDDIQFLAKKEQTQEEFFHTFNDLYNREKQIILTSDRPPKEIPTLGDRLRTRFEWGLIADIQAPELETRIAILRKKMELNQYHISDEILHFIASQIPTNVREMEGALTRIVAYASLLDTEVTLSIASNVIKDMVGIKQEKPLTIAHIQKNVSDYFNISTSDLCSKIRTKEIAYARQISMYITRELTNNSLPKIGENFGNRDHTTVMHACDKIKQLLKSDSETKNIITVLISNIKNTV